jgi:hypothetical protein
MVVLNPPGGQPPGSAAAGLTWNFALGCEQAMARLMGACAASTHAA